MLPQVANHILHHTTRAVAAAQNQAGHTLRNVLGFQTGSSTSQSSSPGLASWNNTTGSSGWGNGHAGAGGGARYHAGSRFYAGYTGPGRAIAQANASSADASITYADENDESRPVLVQPVIKSGRVPRKTRSRSHSFSLGSDAVATAQRAESFGVLQAVQQHARLHHAFAGPSRPEDLAEDVELSSRPSTPRLTRRNSTASTVSVSGPSDNELPPPRPVAPADPTDPAHPQTVLPPDLGTKSPGKRSRSSSLSSLPQAQDPFQVRARLVELRQPNYASTVDDWNAVIAGLISLRQPNEQPTEILQAYNDMITRSIMPDYRTYSTLISLLATRDEEVHRIVKSASSRIEKRHALGFSDHSEDFVDQQRIAAVRAEQNFDSAFKLFVSASVQRNIYLPMSVHLQLLDCCVRHQSIKQAIRVFSHLEKRGMATRAAVYARLLDVYTSLNDVEGARVVFEEFRKVCAQGKIDWDLAQLPAARAGHIRVWNSMIEAYLRASNPSAALGLLGEMLDTKAGAEFGPADVPAPSMSTYSTIVRCFCLAGDATSAISWFERLLDQGKPVESEWVPMIEPPQPSDFFWRETLDQLSELDRIEDVNRLFARYITRFENQANIPYFMRRIVYVANVQHLQTNEISAEDAGILLDQALSAIGPRKIWRFVLTDVYGREATRELVGMNAKYGRTEQAVDLLEELATYRRDGGTWPERGPYHTYPDESPDIVRSLSNLVIFDNGAPRELALSLALRIAKVWASRGIHINQALGDALLRAYSLAREQQERLPQLDAQDWEALAFSISSYGRTPSQDVRVPRALELLTDMARVGANPGQVSEGVIDGLIRPVVEEKGLEEVTALMENLGAEFAALLATPKTFSYIQPAEVPEPQSIHGAPELDIGPMRIDDHQSRYVDDVNMRVGKEDAASIAFQRFEKGAAMGIFPTPEVVGRLIECLGRASDMDKVGYLYGVAQNILSLLRDDKAALASGWAAIENAMIIARGHAGDGISADVHRVRLLEQGMTPNADAYGALIQCIKDTTDDTARALEYFHESQMRGVQPNVFLYNTTISKLAKARKAEYALELFNDMKKSGLTPSSITYGAVIAACCRVGDSVSAEALFEEMTTQPNFRPRVPPYNTMMQFYVQTKPNRSRFLHYFNRMTSAGIKPTAHSYKLILDCYGAIAPVDIKSMEKTFAQLVKEKSVTVQGSHWAALINAHGCVGKDLEKAIAVFNSIEKHPSTLASKAHLPDAVTYEALINVLVTLRRTDLIPDYLDRLRRSGVHMTAYIANLLIRGHAAAGEIERARAVFESLADPPVGVAAPNNHAPHNATSALRVPPHELVYREPSTWEAMVRAELGSGNREHALALISRVQERQYPESIVGRISGIMLDDAVSPWPSTPPSSVEHASGTHSPQ
ncbi:hypothetical protein BC834DRAFT_951720 [Gloeopeniophorella convolvens]|nr:hypothetical protein BC834DRAFT_951720 [Gloeopeniophorella convolvens]